jgi:hypothetical protein
MPLPPDTDLSTPEVQRDLRLWALMSVGPALSFMTLLGCYWLTGEKCHELSRTPLVVLVSVAAIGILLMGGRAYRAYRRSAAMPPGLPADTGPRIRFMTLSAVGLNAFSLLLLAALVLPILVLRPCE